MPKQIDRLYLLARLGLAACFIYAGVSALIKPDDWIGFIPHWLVDLSPIPAPALLQLHSIFEVVLGGGLIVGWQRRMLGVISTADLLVILILNGVNTVTFRDFGLVALALILVF